MTQTKADQIKRKWLLFMILGPGIFFIVYWLVAQPGRELQRNTVEPPAKYHQLGQSAAVDGKSYLLQSGDQIFANEISLKNNLTVPEPGYIFLGLSLKADSLTTKPIAQIIDAGGRLYQPIQIDPQIVSQCFGLTNQECFLYLFKVNLHADCYYFLLADDPELTWRIPGYDRFPRNAEQDK